MKKLILSALAAAAMFATPALAYQSYSYGSPTYYGSSYGSGYGHGYYGSSAYRAPAQYINIGSLDSQPYYGGGYYGGAYSIRPATYRTGYSYSPTYSYPSTSYSYPTTPAYSYPSYSTSSYSYPSYNQSYPYSSYGYGSYGTTYGRYVQPAAARVISTQPYYGSYGYGYPSSYSTGYSYRGW